MVARRGFREQRAAAHKEPGLVGMRDDRNHGGFGERGGLGRIAALRLGHREADLAEVGRSARQHDLIMKDQGVKLGMATNHLSGKLGARVPDHSGRYFAVT